MVLNDAVILWNKALFPAWDSVRYLSIWRNVWHRSIGGRAHALLAASVINTDHSSAFTRCFAATSPQQMQRKGKKKKKNNKNSKELCLGYVISFLPVKDLVEVSQLFWMQPVPVCARDSGGSCFPSVTYNLPSSLQHPECPFSLFFF